MITSKSLRAEAETLEASAKRLRAMAAEIDAAVTSPPVTPASPPSPIIVTPGLHGIQDPAAFFASLKRSDDIFPTDSLNQGQVDGINAILNACAGRCGVGWAAYVLATPYHETGATFETDAVESLNYSVEALISKFSRERISVADAQRVGRAAGHPADQEAIANLIYGGPWGLRNLGNEKPGDGWKYRGRSWPQLTGLGNYRKADDKLGLGGRLVEDPSIIAQPEIAAPVLLRGMLEGWFRPGNSLNDFISHTGNLKTFTNARAIINAGGDRAHDIAVAALAFQDGLVAGKWA